jgi:hypothetical protein
MKAVKINRKRDGNNARGKMDGPERWFLYELTPTTSKERNSVGEDGEKS